MAYIVNLTGRSGASHQYYAYALHVPWFQGKTSDSANSKISLRRAGAAINDSWLKLPGNYLFVRAVSEGASGIRWDVLYAAETENFSGRLPKHERLGEAIRRGATHVLVRANLRGEIARKLEAIDLIKEYGPPMNNRGLTVVTSPPSEYQARASQRVAAGDA